MAKKLLTVRKQAWVKQFKPDVILGQALNPNASIEARYYDRLANAINEMCAETEKKLRALFKKEFAQEYFAQDASIASQARILTNALTEKFESLFSDMAKPTAEQMVGASNQASKSALNASIKELSGGLNIKTDFMTGPLGDVINASVVENVGLIKSIATKYLDGVQGAVMRSITTGNGLQDLVPYLKKHKGITLRRARNIAGDQTRKAYNTINKERMQTMGVKKFRWLHSAGGAKPRKLHVAMNGNIYSFDNLPVIDERTGERGIPGQAINCRCRMMPVIEFEGASND